MNPSYATLAAENADLRAQLAALEQVALELIAERDRAVAELERAEGALSERELRGIDQSDGGSYAAAPMPGSRSESAAASLERPAAEPASKGNGRASAEGNEAATAVVLSDSLYQAVELERASQMSLVEEGA